MNRSPPQKKREKPRQQSRSDNNFYCFDDFAKVARKKLPKFVFDFVEGGSGSEKAIANNVSVFQNNQLVPRVVNGKQTIDLSTEVLGIQYDVPFGIAPLGLSGLIHPDAEVIFAKKSAQYNAPYIYSSVSNTSLDKVCQSAGAAPWFQLYIPKLDSLLNDLLDLAEQSMCPALVITVDTARPGKRIRDLKNGLKLPFKLHLKNASDILQHPAWAIRRMKAGMIRFPSMDSFLKDSKSMSFSEMMSMQTGGSINWDTIRYIRKYWKKKIVLKGILSTEDAIKAKEYGVDAVIISNHGGRQLNSAPAPFSLIEKFSNSGINKESIIIDSGIREGEDILSCIASGASFAFLGRLFLFALAAKGEQGVNRAFQLLIEELNTATALMGVNRPNELDSSYLL